MSLAIYRAQPNGDADSEYIMISVKKDTNLKDYLIVDRTYDRNKQISDRHRHVFILPDIEVSEGDAIRLCTGTGSYSFKIRSDSTILHYIFMNLKKAIWNDCGDQAEIWNFKRISRKTFSS